MPELDAKQIVAELTSQHGVRMDAASKQEFAKCSIGGQLSISS